VNCYLQGFFFFFFFFFLEQKKQKGFLIPFVGLRQEKKVNTKKEGKKRPKDISTEGKGKMQAKETKRKECDDDVNGGICYQRATF
jgi:hypothetical protein